jgi:hypothetical protein
MGSSVLLKNGMALPAPVLAELLLSWTLAENDPTMPDTLSRYEDHLRATVGWIRRSIRNGRGGSAAHFSFHGGWSAPYPETTGYIIPTLLDAAIHQQDRALQDDAEGIGRWLLGLQNEEGWWPGGLLTPRTGAHPSIFNSAQVIDGMVALARRTGDDRWKVAALKGSVWLAEGVDSEGLWRVGNYRQGINPSYYSQVAWPMLQAWELTRAGEVRDAAVRVLRRIMRLKTDQGSISGWGFDPGKPAFTHTIAYTLRGFLESAVILDDWKSFAEPCLPALEGMCRKSELANGRLPGAFHNDWQPVDWYSCLTGNAQIALCLLRLEQKENDLRLVNAAAKLVDFVCSRQKIGGGLWGICGAVAGSSPLWGRYMFMRYPNWAAKYHADALMMLRDRLQPETAL